MEKVYCLVVSGLLGWLDGRFEPGEGVKLCWSASIHFLFLVKLSLTEPWTV